MPFWALYIVPPSFLTISGLGKLRGKPTQFQTTHCLRRQQKWRLLIVKPRGVLSRLTRRTHTHLKLHRHVHLSCCLAHRKLVTQSLDHLPTRVLRARRHRQRADEKVCRAECLRTDISVARGTERAMKMAPTMGLQRTGGGVETKWAENFEKHVFKTPTCNGWD